MNPNETLVEDYVSAVKKGKSALVISPTHQQGEEVTKAIREKLRSENLLGKKEISINKLTNLNLTEAQKKDWRNFKEGQVLQFNQNVPNFKRGSVWAIESLDEKQIKLKNSDGEINLLPKSANNKFFDNVINATKFFFLNKKVKQVTTEVLRKNKDFATLLRLLWAAHLVFRKEEIKNHYSNKQISEENILKASEIACEELVFGSNMRASKEYRKAICKSLVKSALMEVSSC